MTSEGDPGLVTELTRRNIPTVFMDTGKPGPHCANIRIDYAQGIHEAMDHLYALNHRRIGFITGPMTWSQSGCDEAAFLSVLKIHGLPERALIESETTASRWSKRNEELAEVGSSTHGRHELERSHCD